MVRLPFDRTVRSARYRHIMSTNTTAANILIDMVSGYDTEADDETNGRVYANAIAELSNAQVIVARQSDDGALDLYMDALFVASGWTHRWLLDQLSAATGKDRDTLLFELREWVATREG